MASNLTKEQEMLIMQNIMQAKLSKLTGHMNIMNGNTERCFFQNKEVSKGKLRFLLKNDEKFRDSIKQIIKGE